MAQRVVLLSLIILLLTACGVAMPQALPTPSPTYVGTWEAVLTGTVYDGRREPIAGAIVQYVPTSLFPELQENRPNTTETDTQGMFSLSVTVHDTDRIQIVVEAPGFAPYEESLTGFDLASGRKTFEIELAPA